MRGKGFDEEGEWVTIDTTEMNGPGSYQLNLMVYGSGTVIVHPALAASPRKLRLDNNGVFIGDYAMD